MHFFSVHSVYNMEGLAKEYTDAGYRWEMKKVTKPGETEPVIQMHLVPPLEVVAKQREEHARVMREYKQRGFISIPDDLALATGIRTWDPKNKQQTDTILAEMTRQD